jgi:hypothetical protein
MNTLLDFAALLLLTIVAGTLALALDWLLLRAAFRLMRPAGEPRPAGALPLAAPR